MVYVYSVTGRENLFVCCIVLCYVYVLAVVIAVWFQSPDGACFVMLLIFISPVIIIHADYVGQRSIFESVCLSVCLSAA